MTTTHVYEKWRAFNGEYLEKCRGKYVAVTFSAGKDSSACLYLLNEAKKEYGYDLGGFIYVFPKHRYSSAYLEKLPSFWEKLGIHIEFREAAADDFLTGV